MVITKVLSRCRAVLLLAGLACAWGASAMAQDSQRFPFAMPWDDASKTAIDCSDLNPAPLTEKQRVTARNGHFYDATGRRVRIVGTNLVAGANFSDPLEFAKVAARMHKFGFNCVRLHHMDAAWANPNLFGDSRDHAAGPNQQISPATLRLLDNTIAQCKAHGIYLNLNLHVSRQLTAGDGFPDTDKLPGGGKVVAYFEPRFIQMQKDYARQLLDHVNPQTKMRLANDPALAFIELNNEDSLTGEAWNGSLQAMPPHYRGILREDWNTFLKARYPDTNALRRTWSGGDGQNTTVAPANLLRNARFEGGTNDWGLEQQGDAKGALRVEDIDPQMVPAGGESPQGRALRVSVQQLADQGWKLQLHQKELDLHEGAAYTLTLWARADAPRAANLYCALDQDPWSQVGGQRKLDLTTQWQKFRVVFRASGTRPQHTRLSLSVGEAMGDVSIADVNLVPGAIADMSTAQTLEAGNIDLPPAFAMTEGQARDWMACLVGIERTYTDTMRGYLKRELKTRALITCSQASYGGLAGIERESHSDYVDMHAYWQHPSFPHKSWDSRDWNITNTAMTDDPDGGVLLGLAAYRIADKPFTVSEYNHPAPNDYANETVLSAFAMAAAQDWDGVYLFDYNGSTQWNPGKIRGFFDVDSDPNKMAWLPTAARMFLTGAVTPLPNRILLTIPRDSLVPLAGATYDLARWDALDVTREWKARGLTRRDLQQSRMEVLLTGSDGSPSLGYSDVFVGTVSLPVSWGSVGRNGVLRVNAPSAQALIGRWATSWDGPQQLGALRVDAAQSSNGWAIVSAVARDGQPLSASRSIVLTAMNRAENAGMGWNADRTSVSDQWGSGPPQVEVPQAAFSLRTSATEAQVWALDATGKRAKTIASQLKNGMLTFSTGPRDQAVWYEVACQMPSRIVLKKPTLPQKK